MKALSLKGFGDLSSGDRASIYQYISRLEGYFLPTTQVTILLKDPEEISDSKEYFVELTVSEGGGLMTAKGKGQTVLDAVKMCSELILNQFVQIQSMIQRDRWQKKEAKESLKSLMDEAEEINLDIEEKRKKWH